MEEGQYKNLVALKPYVTGPSDSNLAILLLSGVLGFKAPNFRFLLGRFVSSNVAVKLASSNAFLGAEIDHASPPEQLKEFRELLSAKSQFDSHVKIYPGVNHGWTDLRTKQPPRVLKKLTVT